MTNDNLTPEVNEVTQTVDRVESAATETAATPAKDLKKKKKKKKYTVEEILAEGGIDPNAVDDNGRKRKVKVRTKSKLKRREARMGYFFILPWLIGTLSLLAAPMITTLYWSFNDIKVMPAKGVWNRQYMGLAQYKETLSIYQDFPTDLASLFVRLTLSVPVVVVFALLMAMLLNMKLKGKGIFRTIYFLPVIVVSGPVMAQISSESGRIDAVDLTTITAMIQGALPRFIATPVISIFEQIIMILWYGGVQILIFLAALQKINPSLYEAAKIDGGSGWECFWKITLPTIRPMILLNAIYTVVFLSADETSNAIITYLAGFMTTPRGGYSRTSALGWMYSIIILVFIGLVALVLMEKRDIYAKQAAKRKKFEKRTRKNLAKSQKHLEKNNKKYAKHLAKQEARKKSGKKLKGGEPFDD